MILNKVYIMANNYLQLPINSFYFIYLLHIYDYYQKMKNFYQL